MLGGKKGEFLPSIDIVVVMRVTRTTGMNSTMRSIELVLIGAEDTSCYYNIRQSGSLAVYQSHAETLWLLTSHQGQVLRVLSSMDLTKPVSHRLSRVTELFVLHVE